MRYVQFGDELEKSIQTRLEGLRTATETSVPSGNRDLRATSQTKIYQSTARHKPVATPEGGDRDMCGLSSAYVT
jgi:hypothetical protein